MIALPCVWAAACSVVSAASTLSATISTVTGVVAVAVSEEGFAGVT